MYLRIIFVVQLFSVTLSVLPSRNLVYSVQVLCDYFNAGGKNLAIMNFDVMSLVNTEFVYWFYHESSI